MKKTNNKKNYLPQSPLLFLFIITCLLACVIFMGAMTLIDALPGAVVGGILAAIVIMLVIIIKLLSCKKSKTFQRKIGIGLSLFLIVCLGFGTYYLYNTYSMFNKISGDEGQAEEFHVIVLQDSEREKLRYIRGDNVFVTEFESSTYKEAKETLVKKAKVTYKPAGDFIETAGKLIDDKGTAHDEVIFLSNAYYEILCEDIDGFKDGTKIIYTVSVQVDSKDSSKRVDVTKDPFNIYISGIDTFGSIKNVARSDVNMIMTVNPLTKEILLTSIPRDMYLPLHTFGAKDKLTHSGIYGINETTATVEDWLGIDINYYVRVNFTTLVDIVDVIGGIDVESEYAFSSSVSEHSYAAGMNHLNGEEALFFARERKTLSGGDNERVKNQQRVLKGIINKVTTSPVVLTKYNKLLDAVGDEMQTSLTEKDIAVLVKMQLKDLGEWEIKTISIYGKGTHAVTYSMGSRELYVAIPDEASVKEARKAIDITMIQ